MNYQVELHAQKTPWGRTIELLVIERRGDKLSVGTYVTMQDLKESDLFVQRAPTLSIDYNQAQALMDELWTCGLRPSEGSGSAGALAATQKHLDDMRRLVFNGVPTHDSK